MSTLSIQLPGPFTFQEGEYVHLQPEVSYSPESGQCSSGPLMFSASGLPDGLSLDANTGLITGVLPHNLANRISPTREYTITLTASDGIESASTSATVTIRDKDYTLPSPDDRFNNEGDYLYLDMHSLWGSAYAGPNAEVHLMFSAYNLPVGLSIDLGTDDSFCTGGGELRELTLLPFRRGTLRRTAGRMVSVDGASGFYVLGW